MTREELEQEIADYLTDQFVYPKERCPPDECLEEARYVIKLVVEECAKICEQEMASELTDMTEQWNEGYSGGAENCLYFIRKLLNPEGGSR